MYLFQEIYYFNNYLFIDFASYTEVNLMLELHVFHNSLHACGGICVRNVIYHDSILWSHCSGTILYM